MLGWNFQVPEHVVNGPRYNPNNGDEIIFIERPFGSQTQFHLHRYRISIGTDDVILSGSNLVNMSYPADWGSTGWLLLNLSSQTGSNIYKLMDNGDSLTQVTFTSMNFNPLWSPSGDSFGYQYQPGQQFAVKYEPSTGASDTLSGFFDQSSTWYTEEAVSTVSYTGVWNWDMASGEVHKVCELPAALDGTSTPAGTAMLPDGRTLVWAHIDGLFRTDMITGSTV